RPSRRTHAVFDALHLGVRGEGAAGLAAGAVAGEPHSTPGTAIACPDAHVAGRAGVAVGRAAARRLAGARGDAERRRVVDHVAPHAEAAATGGRAGIAVHHADLHAGDGARGAVAHRVA